MNNQESFDKTNKITSFSPRKAMAGLQERISSSPYSYMLYCFLVPVAVMYFIYIAMEIHPFGDGSVLVLDLNGQYVSFYEALRSIIYGDGSMLYSFSRGLGGEFIGIYAYYIASPLSYIVALFPQSRILDALLTIILLKVGLCGLSFGFYLHKNSKQTNKPVVIALSVMYALCAYAVVYQNNIMWIDALIWLPLITYGIEQLIKNRKYKLFVISLSLCIMSNFYIGYMTCIYVALYYFYYSIAHPQSYLNPRGEKLHYLRSFIRITCFSLLAVAISAFIILGAYYSLGFGKTEFSNPNWSFKTKFDFLDFFTKFLPGSYDTVRPKGLPFVYCGVLTLILVPVYFLTKKISSREKIASLAFICVFILSFIARPLDLIWHGFQLPNWLNYRYSFMLCFFLLVLAYKGFGNLRSVSEKFILGICAFIILFVTVCDKLKFESYVESNEALLNLETVWLTIFATVAFLVTLCLLIRKKNPLTRENVAGILTVLVCVEIFCSGFACVNQHRNDVGGYTTAQATYSFYNTFIGDLRPIVNDITESDKGFYRAEKLVHKKKNDNMALGLKGISNSTSTLNAETIRFLNRMGYVATSNYSFYYGGNPVNDSLLGVKYIIDLQTSDKLDTYYEPYKTNGKYTAYYNPYALSLAFGVDSAVADFDMERYSSGYEHHFQRMNALVTAMIGNDTLPNIFIPVDKSDITTQKSSDCMQSTLGSSITYSSSGDETDPYVTYTFIAPRSEEYYFYAPSKGSSSVKLTVNNADMGTYLSNDKKYIVPIGYFSEGEEVTIKLSLNEDEITLYSNYNYIWYIDRAAYETAFTALRNAPQFNITEYTDDNLKGNIATTAPTQMMQTTIPYDEGWKVYVDGDEVEIFKTLDALIAFNIDGDGEHTLEFKYSPKIYKVGAMISTVGIAVFVLLCILDTIFYFTIIKKKERDLCSNSESYWILEDFDKDCEELKAIPAKTPKKFKERITGILAKINKKDTKDSPNKDSNTSEGDK